MSTTYTGNSSNTQAPSPTPGPGVPPVVVLPADGDADNAASVAQAFKVLADFIAWLVGAIAVASAWAQSIFWWSDARGHKRYEIGHWGIPAGSVFTHTEMWSPAAGFGQAGIGPFTNGSWTFTSSAAGNSSLVSPPGVSSGLNFSNLAPCLQINLDSSGSGKHASWGDEPMAVFVDESIVELEWDASAFTVLSVQWDMGFAANGAAGSISKGVYFSRPDSPGTNWKAIAVDGGSPTTVDTGILANATSHQFRIACVGAGVSDDATARALFYIDGVVVADITSNLPVNDGSLMSTCFGGITTGSTASPRLLIGVKVSRQNTRLASF